MRDAAVNGMFLTRMLSLTAMTIPSIGDKVVSILEIYKDGSVITSLMSFERRFCLF
jgi:hypothetical protein